MKKSTSTSTSNAKSMKKKKKKVIVKRKKKTAVGGKGLVNKFINKLPFEMHIPSYHYCGPGTKLQERLAKNDPGINELDRACKQHDIAYSLTDNQAKRNLADDILARAAWERVKASDSSVAERLAALGVAGFMKVKSRAGMGIGTKRTTKQGKKSSVKKPTVKKIFQHAVKTAREIVKLDKPKRLTDAAKLAVNAARLAVKGIKPNRKIIESGLPRIIPVPKVGGILPLVPIFAGLSALGALIGGSAGVANAVLSAQKAKKDLQEAQRHNQTMESIALGHDHGRRRRRQNSSASTTSPLSAAKVAERSGSGLHLKPYKNGLGLYLTPMNQSKNE